MWMVESAVLVAAHCSPLRKAGASRNDGRSEVAAAAARAMRVRRESGRESGSGIWRS